MGVPRRFLWVTFLMSKEALRHSRVWDFVLNVARLPVLVVYDEYQKAKAWKRHLSYTPPPRLTRALYRLMVCLPSHQKMPRFCLTVTFWWMLTGY
uniref:Uncharacterized protein n=1 Tax=Brassica oleracea TaxID=3712 RepID=A0A3P6ERM0_BRAOL|nr:unnamed protein product [Brassica oleracea]